MDGTLTTKHPQTKKVPKYGQQMPKIKNIKIHSPAIQVWIENLAFVHNDQALGILKA